LFIYLFFIFYLIRYLKDRKEKLKKKSQKVKEPEDRKTFDNIKFGEVAETVPTITVKPKMKKV